MTGSGSLVTKVNIVGIGAGLALPNDVELAGAFGDRWIAILLIASTQPHRRAPVGAIVVAIKNFTEHVAAGGDAGFEDEVIFPVAGFYQAPAVVLRRSGCRNGFVLISMSEKQGLVGVEATTSGSALMMFMIESIGTR